MTLRTADWTFTSGVTAVAETRLLTNDEYLDLLRLPTLQALLQRIKQVETYSAMPVPDSPDEATRAVEHEFVRNAGVCIAGAPDRSVCEVMLTRYRFAELRSFLRAKLSGGEDGGEPPAFFAPEELDALWDDRVDARGDLAPVVRRLRRALEDAEDAERLLDLWVDREELTHVLEGARAIGSEFITTWAETCVRLLAALTVIRARLSGEHAETLTDHFLLGTFEDETLLELAREDRDRMDNVLARIFTPVEGEIVDVTRREVGSIARMMDDRLTSDMAAARMIPFGPERPFGYLWGLHIENLNLRMITETFVVEGDRDETRTRLRRSYVG